MARTPPLRSITGLDPRHLRCLRMIVECGTYHDAAERLGVTQPMLSKIVQQIERALGIQVLTRGRHGARPTVFGERLVAWSKVVDADLVRAHQDIDDIKGLRAGHVRVGAVPPLAVDLLPRAIARLKSNHPGVLVSLREDNNHLLAAALAVGDLDMVIGGVGLEPRTANTQEELLIATPVVGFVGKNHPLARRRKVSLRELHAYPWIKPLSGTLADVTLAALIGSASLERFSPSVETNSYSTTRMLLLSSHHFVLEAPDVFAKEVRQKLIKALDIEGNPLIWRFGIKWRRDDLQTPAMQAFAEHVRWAVRQRDHNKK